VTSRADIELAFYERFLFAHGLEPYPVQEQAFEHIFAGDNVLVSVPTGTGKTLLAKAAIDKALALGQTAIYTTPLRALTEEKHRELSADFGAGNVGFATGDYQVNPDAPIQVVVAEILWNKIIGDRVHAPADVVVMDEGHYFNDAERGYVWEQSIIGLDPRTQLIILSATVGHPDRFCQWVEVTRQIPLRLVESRERKVPLYHEWREEYLIDVVRDLASKGDVPAIVFVFGREACFEVARLLKSCRRFTTDEEKATIEKACKEVLLDGGAADELKALLTHGIGVHHAGIMPRYKELVERLTLERLVKFVVSTETISAGINLPAKRVVFPSLIKFIKKTPRLLTAAEFHQMAGRAGRPQFDAEGVAIALAPEAVIQDMRKEIADTKKRGRTPDEAKIRKASYGKARAEAQRNGGMIYEPEDHRKLVEGEPAELRSRTKITPEQVLAIGLPDLAAEALPGALDPDAAAAAAAARAALPPSMRLDIVTVVDHMLVDDKDKKAAHRTLAHVTDNMRALGVIDEHGRQIAGEVIGRLHGIDGMFVWYALMSHPFDLQADCRALCELLVDHDAIQRVLDRKDNDKKRDWIKARLRELRDANPQASWDDAEAEYDQKFPRELTPVELIHQEFSNKLPHPELHGGKRGKAIWATIEDEQLGFHDYVDRHRLAHEEGSLFTYLARVMKTARRIAEGTSAPHFAEIEARLRSFLAVLDPRMSEP
jgi:hypothetical protein